MERDRQIVLIGHPQLVKQPLRLAARVDKDQRRAMPLDGIVDARKRVDRRMPCPGDVIIGVEDRNVRLRPTFHRNKARHWRIVCLWQEPASQSIGVRDSRGKSDRLHAGL